ncbi:alpha/beta fold hydrolase [Legionella hackeliae]|uniref:Putative Carboxylesterase n=1 Tax=Legionella hackeliae TaxID=449 RepID=A0A0A8UVD8_LEGHA|nr:alpha/beta hydrolase [Legionella hackeliae]KTD15161.1 lipolytic protein [Legionella hackeliae]CEK11476.1 putative Carboxylesterase [Legionella hackeliae]STX48246.1 lipolytic protein [Legionella hackeliae]
MKRNIVFLPGLGCDERSFAQQAKVLESQFNVQIIVCDTSNNMDGHVDFVLNKSPEQMILIGHSFGGWIAQWVAIHGPQRVSHLILMGTATGKLTPQLRAVFEDMLRNFEKNQPMEFFDKLRLLIVCEQRKNDKDLLGLIKTMQRDFSLEGLLNQVRTDLEGKETTPYLKNIHCPTLLMLGKQDFFYQEEMRILKENIPNNEFVEIEDCGHSIPLEKPERVTALLQDWLK